MNVSVMYVISSVGQQVWAAKKLFVRSRPERERHREGPSLESRLSIILPAQSVNTAGQGGAGIQIREAKNEGG